MINTLLAFACFTSLGQNQSDPSTTFPIGEKCPPVTASFTYGPWKGKADDVVKASGTKPLVILLTNPMQTDLDTMLALSQTLGEAQIKHSEAGVSVAIIAFYTGRPDGESSKPWLTNQLKTLSQVMNQDKISLAMSPIGSELRTAFKLRDGFKNAVFIIREGVVKAICDSVDMEPASQKKLAASIDKGLGN